MKNIENLRPRLLGCDEETGIYEIEIIGPKMPALGRIFRLGDEIFEIATSMPSEDSMGYVIIGCYRLLRDEPATWEIIFEEMEDDEDDDEEEDERDW